MKYQKIFSIIILVFIVSCNNKPKCIINKNNEGKLEYDINEAACYISLNLGKKSPKIELIKEALVVEEKYMYKLGLISGGEFGENNNKPVETLHIDKLIEFTIKNKVKLTRSKLYDIYEAEIEYFKFIGLVD